MKLTRRHDWTILRPNHLVEQELDSGIAATNSWRNASAQIASGCPTTDPILISFPDAISDHVQFRMSDEPQIVQVVRARKCTGGFSGSPRP
jgi:hypothetical protein